MGNLQRTRLNQQLYFLNAIANININYIVKPLFNKKKRAGDKLYKQAKQIEKVLADDEVKKFMGTWELVWGPYISFSNIGDFFKKSSNSWATDNTVYMAKLVERPASDTNKALPDYFIGIAGTNPASPYGWFVEDFDVEYSVPWPPVYLDLGAAPDKSSSTSQIAEGTSLGLCRIWHMGTEAHPPCKGTNAKAHGLNLEVGYRPTSGQALWEYIEEHVATGATIMVGGHSLAGALSPTLATALADKMKTKKHKVKISAFPTAGPTPGNEAFADHIADMLDSYHATINQVDLIPHVWEQADMKKIPGFNANCGFEGFPLVANNQLVVRFVDWARSKPKMIYKRTPSTPRANFTVETWDNGCINIDAEKNAKGKSLRETLPKGVNGLYDFIRLSKVLKNDLSTIHGSELDFSKDATKQLVKEFLAFLMYAGSQHTIAYSSSREKGFQLPDDVIGAYKAKLRHTKIKSALDGETSLKYLFGTVAAHYKQKLVEIT